MTYLGWIEKLIFCKVILNSEDNWIKSNKIVIQALYNEDEQYCEGQ